MFKLYKRFQTTFLITGKGRLKRCFKDGRIIRFFVGTVNFTAAYRDCLALFFQRKTGFGVIIS
ncbi:hypothetical protein HMPREF2753_05105 [Neisseria sp. HMSC071C03]|nr:hypothetical protein HMPREF3054_07555 [Neisseria sp. HMSC071B12]OHR47180.1 hypothetical protein HMPREF2753_05105 [Neisseria sp. HMSC071C03]